jgi:NodT family efflux transporter outer membrane factor (OMF) lipoprotein
MKTSRLLLAFLALQLAGCARGREHVLPATPIAAAYKETPPGWKVAAPADVLERGPWWMLFNDPLLDELERKVEVSNQTLAEAEARYRSARALVQEQRSALFPTVDISGSSQRAQSSAGATGVRPPASNSYRIAIGGTWEPDVWGRIRSTVTAAEASAEASAADLAAARLSVQGELATNYLQLRNVDSLIALLVATVDAYEEALRITQNRFDAGIAPRSDVLQAETQLASAQADLEGLDRQRAQLEHAIAVLIGEAPGNFSLAVALQTDPVVPVVPPGIPSQLLLRRPDIAAAERRVASANASIGAAEAAFFPDFSLTGTYGFSGPELGRFARASQSLWSLGLAVAQTVFDGGARAARTDQAKAEYDRTVANYRQTALTAFGDVEDQLAAARVLERQQELRQQASRAADEAERLAINQYQAGRLGYADVIVAQVAAFNARRQLAQVIADRQTSAVALIQALGGGWSTPPR